MVSAKDGCAPEGTCGCCLVMVDGHPALSCLRKPEQMDGRDVVTVEGLPDDTRRDAERSVRARRRRAVRVLHPGDSRPRGVVDAAGRDRRSRRGRESARRASLPLHRLRPDHRRHPDRRRSVAERRVAAEHRAAAAFLFRRRVRADAAIPHSPAATETATATATATGDGIGRSVARHGGLEQALGEKPFVDDMRVPGMLHGAMVLTEHPRAKILKIHTDEAAAMPGVVRVFTAADVPGNRGTGLNDPDQPVFVAEGELTCCVADFLAMVVADTPFHARRAAGHGDGRLRGARTDHRSVRGAGARRPAGAFGRTPSRRDRRTCSSPSTAFSRGDVDAALATAAHVIEATFDTQPIDIAFLEPEACLVVPQGNGVKVHTREPGIGLRPRADRQDPEPGSRRTSRSRWRRAAAPSARKRSCRFRAQTAVAALPAAAAGQDRAHASAVDAAPRQAPCDDASS